MVQTVAQRQKLERQAARIVVKGLLANGYMLSISNGEHDGDIVPEQTVSGVLKAMFATKRDCIYAIKRENGKTIAGIVLLVYGNDGWNAVSDYSTNLEHAFDAELSKFTSKF